MPNFIVVIPARYGSSRLPGKPLLELAGKPMIQHVVERAQSSLATRVIVATDHLEIANVVKGFGAEVVITRDDHCSGTDRIAEVASSLALPAGQILLNVQGDEPDMPAALVNQVAKALADHPSAQMATACTAIESPAQMADPNVVKVVRDQQQFALYFSRANIPFDRDASESVAYRHLGIYAYKAAYVQQFSTRQECELEKIEKLEQLRALWHGEHIICVDAIETPGVGIDTPDDLEQAQRRFHAQL